MAARCRTHHKLDCLACKRQADSSSNDDTMSSLFVDYTSSYDTSPGYCSDNPSSSYDSSSSSSSSDSGSSSCD